MTLIINIIGAGNLGKTIGHLLVKNQLVKVKGVCNTSADSAASAIRFIGEGNYYAKISELPEADITFITVPDDSIPSISEVLSNNPFLKKGSVVIHCSGSLGSEALLAVKNRGCYTASIHPMRSFAKPESSIDEYNGTWCAMEGDPEAILPIGKLFNSIGSISYEINKEKKSLYHAAGVIASNYLVTLSQQAQLCMESAGIEKDMAMSMIINIMRGTVSNLEKTKSFERSLTGPIQRGDISTLKKHMNSFDTEEQKNLYALLGRATLAFTNHNDQKKQELDAVLREGESATNINSQIQETLITGVSSA